MFAGPPFWEAKTPAQWTDDEIGELLADSPWAQSLKIAGESAGLQAYLATAAPERAAEDEQIRRLGRTPDEVFADDYVDFLRDNRGTQIVLAIRLPNWDPDADPADTRRMQQESVLRISRRQFKMTGYFPPSPSDPYLRLAFPKEIAVGDKALLFELYVPGVPHPMRELEFRFKELRYHGRLEL